MSILQFALMANGILAVHQSTGLRVSQVGRLLWVEGHMLAFAKYMRHAHALVSEALAVHWRADYISLLRTCSCMPKPAGIGVGITDPQHSWW